MIIKLLETLDLVSPGKKRFRMGECHIDYSIVDEHDNQPDLIGAIYIDMMWVPQLLRNEGLGRKLLDAFLKEADAAGKTVCLYPVPTPGEKQKLMFLYDTAGFRPDPEADEDEEKPIWIRKPPTKGPIRLSLGSRASGPDVVQGFLDEFHLMSQPHPADHETRVVNTGPGPYEMVAVSIKRSAMWGNPNNTVYLTGLQVPQQNRKNGAATDVMQDICWLADKHKVSIALTAEPMAVQGKKMTAAQLKKFYQKFGFEFNGMRGTRRLSL